MQTCNPCAKWKYFTAGIISTVLFAGLVLYVVKAFQPYFFYWEHHVTWYDLLAPLAVVWFVILGVYVICERRGG